MFAVEVISKYAGVFVYFKGVFSKFNPAHVCNFVNGCAYACNFAFVRISFGAPIIFPFLCYLKFFYKFIFGCSAFVFPFSSPDAVNYVVGILED